MRYRENHTMAAAEQAHAADRFARKIVGILTRSDAARSRRLMGRPLDAHQPQPEQSICLASLYHIRMVRAV